MTVRSFIMVPACLALGGSVAQDSTWVSMDYPAFSCSWQMPDIPTVLDTLGVRLYALELDSGLAITAHFIQEVIPDTSMGSLYQAAFDVEGDTLRAMAQVMLAVSYGELLAITDSTIHGVPYLDLSFAIQEHEEAEPPLVHTRLYYWERRFISFTVTAPYRDAVEAALLAEELRSTIQITAP